MNILSEIVNLSDEITVVDLGASQFATTVNNYDALKQYRTRFFGFEPNESEYLKLISGIDGDHESVHYLPYAIADGNDHTLNICALPGCTSILEPNTANAANYVAFAEPLKVVDRISITTRRLDDIHEINNVDYIKMDIQGAELLALENGIKKIKDALIIECEVEFIEQYKNQPRFSEIELLLRSLGFQFHRFNGYGTRTLSPLIVENDPYTTGNQWLWSDAVFIKDVNTWEHLSDDSLKKIAIIMHESYSSYDFSYRALNTIDNRLNSSMSAEYIELVKNITNLSIHTP